MEQWKAFTEEERAAVDRTEELKQHNTQTQITQHEDAALKTMMQFFADEILPFLKIPGKVVGIGPTELVSLEVKKLYEDFTLVMEDGSWKHFEFQSSDNGIPDLKRFRAYEALASYQNQVDVTTYVLYSGKIKNPVTQYQTGVSTYRVVPIIMQDYDADKHFAALNQKIETGEELTRQDLISLPLSPLMGGESSIKERIKEAIGLIDKSNILNTDDKDKIETMIYVMADKFLGAADMEEIKEMIGMTKLGQMLVEDGWRKGRAEGKAEGRAEGKAEGEQKKCLEIAGKLLGILNDEVIAEKVGLPLAVIKELKLEMLK